METCIPNKYRLLLNGTNKIIYIRTDIVFIYFDLEMQNSSARKTMCVLTATSWLAVGDEEFPMNNLENKYGLLLNGIKKIIYI